MPVRVQTQSFDIGKEISSVCEGHPEVGAVASFVGLVRDINNGDPVSALTLEHYPGMTEKALEQICAEAKSRWEIGETVVIHRVGELKPTEPIVLVVVSSAHRGNAFAACEFIMDYLKTRAPLWKKEQTPQGARWVEARASDAAAAEQWRTDVNVQSKA